MGHTTGIVMASEGIAHGKSDDLACSPDDPEAYRRVVRGFTPLLDGFCIRDGVLRIAERSIMAIEGN
jgi:hypothetical protein